MMRYTYNCGPEMGSVYIDKEKTIAGIAEMCADAEPSDYITVFGFGQNGNLLTEIQKDDDGTVRIFASAKDEDGVLRLFDDTEYISADGDTIKKELERIWDTDNGRWPSMEDNF